jgi:iron complex transport system substrate-binding protein
MSKWHKVLVYAVGFVLGTLIVLSFQRNREPREPHPWHAQTAPEGYYPLEAEDAYGRSLTFVRQPRHFISLAPSITEILFAMDMGDHLQAVSQWCDYPEQARQLRDAGATIGAMDRPDREAVLALRPDLVLGTTLTPPEVFAALDRPGRTVAMALEHKDVAGVLADIATIGKVTGVPGKALQLLQRLRADMEATELRLQQLDTNEPPAVLLMLSLEDDLQPGWSAGAGTWPHDLIQRAHARNVAADLSSSWGQVSPEALLHLAPEVILIRDASSPAGRAALRDAIDRLANDNIWCHVPAVQNGRVHILPYGPLNIPGPRMAEAFAAVAAAIWPQLPPAQQ